MTEPAQQPYCKACEVRLKSVLKDLQLENLETVSAAKACNWFKKGEVIFEEGSVPTGIFCIHQGKIKVYKTGHEGRDQIVRFAKGGDSLGYRALVSGEPYSVSAAALEDSTVCFIPQETFFDVLRDDEHFPMTLIRLLSGELMRAQEQIVHLAQKPVRERLAETLLILREVYGTENGDGSTLNVKLTRDELASVVGTATETLVRTIADLKRENLIATEKKKICILDVPGLLRAGNLHD